MVDLLDLPLCLNIRNLKENIMELTADSIVNTHELAQEATQTQAHISDDDNYHKYMQRLQARFESNLQNADNIFRTSPANLAEEYVSNIPEDSRQHYNCNACRNFLRRFGNLVIVDDAGKAKSAMWDAEDALSEHKAAVSKIKSLVEKSIITGVFYSSSEYLGEAFDGYNEYGGNKTYKHLNVQLPSEHVRQYSPVKTDYQAESEVLQNFKNVQSVLFHTSNTSDSKEKGQVNFNDSVYQKAIALIRTSLSLEVAQKHMGCLQFILDLRKKLDTKNHLTHRSVRKALVWKAVANAPKGFCHPRSNVTWKLLDDIDSGMDDSRAMNAFKRTISSDVYMRPQAPPSTGTVKRAEEIFEKMNLKESLPRRFARLEELQTYWKPKPEAVSGNSQTAGIFGHLETKENKGAKTNLIEVSNSQPMTFVKFIKDILPTAEKIELFIPSGRKIPIAGILTAVNPEAPPILKWDHLDKRNSFSAYTHIEGSLPIQYGLYEGYTPVSAIIEKPKHWFKQDSATPILPCFIVLEKAKPFDDAHSALFPEILKDELHEVRSVIEAYSSRAKREGMEQATAICWDIRAADISKLRVTLGNTLTTYLVDRLE